MESGIIFASLLTSAKDGSELSASRPGLFNPGEIAPVPIYSCLGGPQSRSEQHGEENNLPHSVNRTPAFHPIARGYID